MFELSFEALICVRYLLDFECSTSFVCWLDFCSYTSAFDYKDFLIQWIIIIIIIEKEIFLL